jgi:hypothetical protein
MFRLPIYIQMPRGKYYITIELMPDNHQPIRLRIQPAIHASEQEQALGAIEYKGTLDSICRMLIADYHRARKND